MATNKRLLVALIVTLAVLALLAVAYRSHARRSGAAAPSVASAGESVPSGKSAIAASPPAQATPQAGQPVIEATAPLIEAAEAQLDKALAPRKSPYTGNPTDLTPQEEKRAMDLWRAWHAHWARFRGLSGQIAITPTDENGNVPLDNEGKPIFSITATITVHVPDLNATVDDFMNRKFPPRGAMTVADTAGKWQYTYDATSGGKLTCDDAQLAETLRPYINGGLWSSIWWQPRIPMDPWSSEDEWDWNYQGHVRHVSNIFSHHQAMRNLEALGKPDSYMFAVPAGFGSRGTFRFEEGNLMSAEYRRPGDAQGMVKWGPYKEINGLPFPTEVNYNVGDWHVIYTFSKLKVEWADK